jgi:signal transduction histidine kinase
VVRGAVETMRGQLPQSMSLAANIDNDTAAVGDRDRIEQVLLNLIDNAVKYSPGGGAVTVSAARLEAGARVEVEDEGIGIPQSEQQAIFEKFYRADPNQREVPGGTGLGLYISRELVRRMGGSIGVRSEPGRGSTFFFELPSA